MLSNRPFDIASARTPRPLLHGETGDETNFKRALLEANRGRLDFHQAFITIQTANAVQLLQSNTKRDYLLLQNISILPVYLGFSYQPNSVTGIGAYLAPNSWIEWDTKIPQNDIWAASTGQAFIAMIWGD